MWYLVFLVVGTVFDVNSLGAESFATREHAHQRLQEVGVFAVPALLAGRLSESPEIRFRVANLLYKWQDVALTQQARNTLYSPWFIDYDKLMGNNKLRARMTKIAIADGGFVVSEEWQSMIYGDVEEIQWYWTRDELERNFEQARHALSIKTVGWPFK